MAVVSMKELLEAGVHFGHQTPRWHPRMQSFIFTERNKIHIIDLQQTIDRLEAACREARDIASRGGVILFVGTKKQAQENLAAAAESCGMPYVSQRWLGGTLTNFRTIRQRVEYLQNLEARHERGDFEGLPKKEMLQLLREIDRLNGKLGGIRDMRGLPDMLFIVDVRREDIAVKEATRLEIPIMALVDTNVDPTPIDYPIPSNDDAIRAIKLITEKVAEAASEGASAWRAVQAEEALAFEEEAALPELKVIARAEEARLAAETAEEETADEAEEEPADEPDEEPADEAEEEPADEAEEEPADEPDEEPGDKAEEEPADEAEEELADEPDEEPGDKAEEEPAEEAEEELADEADEEPVTSEAAGEDLPPDLSAEESLEGEAPEEPLEGEAPKEPDRGVVEAEEEGTESIEVLEESAEIRAVEPDE